MPGLITIERPKMSVEMWEKLKKHIMGQRVKRKQEQEQDAEQERHRREQELKRKRDAMTLEDIKDQLTKLEEKLKELRGEKHELFSQLKKLLNEDENKKKIREKDTEGTVPQSFNPLYPSYFVPSTTIMSANNCQSGLYHRIPLNAPISTVVVNSPNSNVMTQISQPQPSQHSATSPAIKRMSIKRPHEKTPSPPPGVSYTGILPVYKTTFSYSPKVPRTTQSFNYQLYYPPSTLSQVAYDTKGTPYHTLSSGQAPQLEPTDHEGNKCYQQIRGINQLGRHPSSSIIPVQTGQAKPGGITGGFPVQRVSGTASVPHPGRDVQDTNLQYPCHPYLSRE